MEGVYKLVYNSAADDLGTHKSNRPKLLKRQLSAFYNDWAIPNDRPLPAVKEFPRHKED
jgi:hypothetical protein